MRLYQTKWRNPTTIRPGQTLTAEQTDRTRRHFGIDYTSRGFGEKDPTPYPFTAGFEGTISIIGGRWNTVDLILSNGNRLQFMHSSEIFVRNGQRVGPEDVIGLTGKKEADKIHLHVGARNKRGEQIDPSDAVIGVRDLYDNVYKQAYEEAEKEQAQFPQLELRQTAIADSSTGGDSSSDDDIDARAEERRRAYEEQRRRQSGGNSNPNPQPPPRSTQLVQREGESDEDFRARVRAAAYEEQRRQQRNRPN
jgi:murein DD-endopeptidase MepM/ murein hydrolase activator NlpD